MNPDLFLAELPYNKESKLELAGFELKDKTSAAFLNNFLDVYNHTHVTMRNGAVYCKTGRNRTLTETFLITKNYFPDLTLDKFFADLTNYLIRSQKKESALTIRGKYIFVCYDIGEAVIGNGRLVYKTSVKGTVWSYDYENRKQRPAAFQCFADFQDAYLI